MDVVLPPIFDDEEDDEQSPTTTDAHWPIGFDNIRCILNNKIQLIGEHPLTVMIARTLVQHNDAIMMIISIAARKAIDDIDSYWIKRQLEAINFKQNDWKMIYNCRSYLLDFARYAALEGQVQKLSDTLRAKQFRKLRVDEVGTSRRDRGLIKRPHFSREYQDDAEDAGNADPYLRDLSHSHNPALFEEEEDMQQPQMDSPESFDCQFKEDKSCSYSSFSPDRSNHQEDLQRRQQLRAELSSNLGLVSALGRGTTKSHTNTSLDNSSSAYGNYDGIEQTQHFVHQRKKGTSIKQQLNNLQKNIRRRAVVAHSELIAQRAIIQSAVCGVAYDKQINGELCAKPLIEPLIAATNSYVQPVKKSCLQKTKRKRASSRRIEFIGDINFDKTTSENFLRAVTETRKRTGQNRTNFISRSFDSLSIDSSELDNNGILLPNCDVPITPAIRENPNLVQGRKLANIQKAITSDFYQIMKRSFFNKKVPSIENERVDLLPVTRLLLTDSMLSSLDCDVFRNMDIMRLQYPRMPIWFLDTLEEWFADDQLTILNGGAFLYSKVFVSLGLDLNFYYADPKGDEITIYVEFLRELLQWFNNKLEYIKKIVSQRERRGQSRQMHCSPPIELNYSKRCEEGIYEDVTQYRIVQIPRFVIITTPEVGGWRRYFAALNKCLRDFVHDRSNSQFFDLLDWAELVKSAPPEEVQSVDERAALLVNVLHSEHGVFYV